MFVEPTSLVLIVDDIPANLDVISKTLNDAGFDVSIATSGERALQQIDRRSPDLILLDIMMPGIDGFETYKRLKSNPYTCNIPVIFITALNDTDTKIKALELGAVDYITKPFQEQEVLARVRTHLQLRYLTENLEQEVAKKTAELAAFQLQLIQNEKMSALGTLVAGIAHEINNPLGFVSASLHLTQSTLKEILQHLELYRKYLPHPHDEILDHAASIDLDYTLEDLPKSINSMLMACDRIQNISNSLRNFSRSEHEYPSTYNIHDSIDSNLLILKYRLKQTKERPDIKVIKIYGDLPLVECYVGYLNQVFMNIFANAIDALEESNRGRSFTEIESHPNVIMIKTELSPDQRVIIRIQDNGKGMSDDVKKKIFKSLFTTKDVGKGTGLGLVIIHQIIVEKHCGDIEVNSTLGEGTEFVISIPVKLNIALNA